MSSIRDAQRVIAAEAKIEELAGGLYLLTQRVSELSEKLDTMLAVASQPRPAQTPQPRPVERR